jgi:solute:Na+ symporter, SSS family
MTHLLDWVGFSFLILVMIGVSYQSAQKSEDYLVAGRSVGLFALVATLVMTEFNTATLLAFSAAGYSAGPMAIGLPLVFLVGLGWYTLTVAKKWKTYNGFSVAGFFTKKYGAALGKTASLFLILAMTGFSATYVKSLSLIFAPWFPHVNMWLLSGALSIIIVLMTLSGGLLSVIRADILSFLVTLILFPALLIIGILKFGSISQLSHTFSADQLLFNPITQWSNPGLPFWFVTSLIVLTMFTYICSPWYGQKIFAAKNKQTAFLAVGIASILVFVLYGCTLLAAAYFRAQTPDLADPEMVVPVMINTWLPTLFRGMAYAILFSAAMTTLTGVWSTMVAMAVSDFGLTRHNVNHQRGLTVTLAIISWLGANLLVDNILNRLILANIPIAALSFALLAGFHWKQVTRLGAWTSLVVGFTWGTICFIRYGDAGGYTWYWAIYGIPLIFVSGAIVSLLTRWVSTETETADIQRT